MLDITGKILARHLQKVKPATIKGRRASPFWLQAFCCNQIQPFKI
jgi:hypothetical protein